MWLKWLPWRYVVRRVALAHGFLDPVSVLARFYRFAQPSEVGAPVELLRAGAVFHARGLMNTGAIQHNLDWVWPYWVERQFNPADVAFIPRAFSLTHVNLTHRNWTAVGLPGVDRLPIVDPRGLLTPHWDGWSLDGWILARDGLWLLPSRAERAEQALDLRGPLTVITRSQHEGLRLEARVRAEHRSGQAWCRDVFQAAADRPAWFVLSLRPYNPEGVSFVHRLRLDDDHAAWIIDDQSRVYFSPGPERHAMSTYHRGDVYQQLPDGDDLHQVECDVGMATAAALYALEPGQTREVEVSVPLAGPPSWSERAARRHRTTRGASESTSLQAWDEALAGSAQLTVGDPRIQFLYEAALRTLILHTPGEVYAGPYTYRRFWVRDAVMILHALLAAGLAGRVARLLPNLLARQTQDGYFLSQEGEWDSNGEALWLLGRYVLLADVEPPLDWRHVLTKGGRWILRKRVPSRQSVPHAGLLPPGFSAEHLGPNDYYYWDDFWSVAGLREAARLLEILDRAHHADMLREGADSLMAAVDASLEQVAGRLGCRAMPASPYRRLDAGAIGSVAAGYPLQLFPAHDPRLLETADWLRANCFVRGGFFQDVIHSGVNAYLTLHVAQLLLRAGDPEWFDLLQAIAALASPTGQWPEAIHPHTGGGCMGDGQHAWAAAEWVMAVRNAVVREEARRLVLAGGIPAAWLADGQAVSYGPAPTPWGKVTVLAQPCNDELLVRWEAAWRGEPPLVEVSPSGYHPQTVPGVVGRVVLQRIAGG
jgi:hypothetical protein